MVAADLIVGGAGLFSIGQAEGGELNFLNNLNNKKWGETYVLVTRLDEVTLCMLRHHLMEWD